MKAMNSEICYDFSNMQQIHIISDKHQLPTY